MPTKNSKAFKRLVVVISHIGGALFGPAMNNVNKIHLEFAVDVVPL